MYEKEAGRERDEHLKCVYKSNNAKVKMKAHQAAARKAEFGKTPPASDDEGDSDSGDDSDWPC